MLNFTIFKSNMYIFFTKSIFPIHSSPILIPWFLPPNISVVNRSPWKINGLSFNFVTVSSHKAYEIQHVLTRVCETFKSLGFKTKTVHKFPVLILSSSNPAEWSIFECRIGWCVFPFYGITWNQTHFAYLDQTGIKY